MKGRRAIRKVAVLGLLAAGLAAVGCVPQKKYRELEMKYEAQQDKMSAYRTEMITVKNEGTVATQRLAEKQKEVDFLENEIRKRDIELESVKQALSEARTRAEEPPLEGPSGYGNAALAQAAAPQGTEVNERTGGIVFTNGILFPPGQWTLKDSGRTALSTLASRLKEPEFLSYLIRVDGHTDDTPIRRSANKDNWELASKWALAVLNFLEEKGIASERLRLAGFSQFEPLVAGATSDARAKNRRVEIVLYQQ